MAALIIILMFFGFILLLMGLRVVKQQERGVVETFGKYSRFVTPGLNVIIPFIQRLRKISIWEMTIDIQSQSVITKDNVEVRIDGIFWLKVRADEENVKKAFYEIDDIKSATKQLAYTNIRDIVAKMNFDEALSSRDLVGQKLIVILDQVTDAWGAKVTKVEIKEIDPPEDIKIAMHKEKTAEQERRAMVKIATGQKESAVQEKEAAILKAEGEKQAAIERAEGQAQAIKLVNESAEKYFIGNAQDLKKLEVTQASLEQNSKIILTQDGIDPVIVMGDAGNVVPLKR
jgi:regulator of protease activity HflC (stomatin/prohibitin superfamily)